MWRCNIPSRHRTAEKQTSSSAWVSPRIDSYLEIEDKLDARFQEGQAAAYAERAALLSDADDIEVAKAVLVAPEAYLATAATECAIFHGTISYEQLRDALIGEGTWARSVALVLKHAIRQHRRGGKSSPDDEGRTRFFNEFARRAAELGLPEIPPKGRKGGAGFLWYPRKETLTQPAGWDYRSGPEGAWLVAKFPHGLADVELTGICPLINLESLKSSLANEPVRVESDKKSVRLRKKVRVLDPDRTLQEQAPEVGEFLERLVSLRDWWERVGRSAVEASLTSPKEIT